MKYNKISIEGCLKVIPNKFELTVLAMNRARDLLMGAVTNVVEDKFAKKQVNIALSEIENGKINLDDLRKRIEYSILNNNLFLKDVKQENDLDNQNDDLADLADEIVEEEDEFDDLNEITSEIEEEIDTKTETEAEIEIGK